MADEALTDEAHGSAPTYGRAIPAATCDQDAASGARTDPATAAQATTPRAVITAAAFVLLAASCSAASSGLIAHAFPDRPAARDLLFEALPYIDAAQYSADVALIGALACLLIEVIRNRPAQVPAIVTQFSVMYVLRAAAMLLTPLASAHGNAALYGIVPLVQYGMWPSGHAGFALLCVLLIDKRAKGLYRTTLALACIVWVSLIVGHAHYSIDVIGGMLLAYFVAREWQWGSLFNPLKRLTAPATAAGEGKASR